MPAEVTEDLLSAAAKLKVVGRAGIGLDNIDIPAATKRGVVIDAPDRQCDHHGRTHHRHDHGAQP
ncbi:MAG: hypothetical protein U5R30_12720 [Deltaproteobacteria bacterium]|nr:hypothetical protein [Deltaproteobacteria bacterium]